MRGILDRFFRLLTAEAMEALLSTLFFLYLAWVDVSVYGEVMYALAAGSVIMKAVQFGLYYPLVNALAGERKEQISLIINRVVIIKLALITSAIVALWTIAELRGLDTQSAWILFLVGLGFAIEALGETFFADLRVRGRQHVEARIKMTSTALAYGYGFLAAIGGLSPIIVSLFKLICGLVRLTLGCRGHLRACVENFLPGLKWRPVFHLFKTAAVFALIEILGIVYNKTNILFLEAAKGMRGVALYSATWNLVDPISVLVSKHLLGWVVFPLLSTLWLSNTEGAVSLVRRTALWLTAVSFPIMAFLYLESDFLIGILYPDEYGDAAWMQKYLVVTILLSFVCNLFSCVMMVAGAERVLLAFAFGATIVNLLINVVLVQPLGLLGGCLVIVLTKLLMTLLTFCYCQIRFRLFAPGDFKFPVAAAAISSVLYLGAEPLIPFHGAVGILLAFYSLILWLLGGRFLGGSPAAATKEASFGDE